MTIDEYVKKRGGVSIYRMSDPQPSWEQDDPSQPNYIKGKPELGDLAEKDQVGISDLSPEVIKYIQGTPVNVLAVTYTINIPSDPTMWEQIEEGYQLVKIAPDISASDIGVPDLDNSALWTTCGLDVLFLDHTVVVWVESIPVEDSVLTLSVLKGTPGGEL